MWSHSWFPRFRCTTPGSSNIKLKRVRRTSRPWLPRSTKSPLKRKCVQADGPPWASRTRSMSSSCPCRSPTTTKRPPLGTGTRTTLGKRPRASVAAVTTARASQNGGSSECCSITTSSRSRSGPGTTAAEATHMGPFESTVGLCTVASARVGRSKFSWPSSELSRRRNVARNTEASAGLGSRRARRALRTFAAVLRRAILWPGHLGDPGLDKQRAEVDVCRSGLDQGPCAMQQLQMRVPQHCRGGAHVLQRSRPHILQWCCKRTMQMKRFPHAWHAPNAFGCHRLRGIKGPQQDACQGAAWEEPAMDIIHCRPAAQQCPPMARRGRGERSK
mmetsp:Transcript_82579/g.256802  ORF Transcript_82579/g.256802 Transcript_82579/m.256802 type:complete len:331 (+) Transcript_82579:209-1201(+)